MADGVKHEAYNINFIGIISFVTLFLFLLNFILNLNFSILFLLSPLIGSIGGLVTTPDSDLISMEYTRFGRLIYKFIKSQFLLNFINKFHTILWSPYIVAVPHRSIISHSLFLSTFIRILYILWLFYFPITIYFNFDLSLLFYIQKVYNIYLTYQLECVIIFIFWSIQDFLHLYLDGIYIYPKKTYKTIKKGIVK